jgi:hypothetical protein
MSVCVGTMQFSGFSANFATRYGPTFNSESSLLTSSYTHLNAAHQVLPHFNEYIYLDTPQQPDPSSEWRMKRYNEMKPVTKDTLIEFLGDTKYSEYPVYRTGNVSTLATAIYDFEQATVAIYTTNPKDSDPVYVLPLFG